MYKLKEAIGLWSDLSWYRWGGPRYRVELTEEKLDKLYHENKKLYFISMILEDFTIL